MLSKILDPIMNIIRFQKKKIALLLGLYIVFLYILFPFNDLGDLVSGKISQATQGQVFLDFDNISLSLFPTPGLSLSKVTVETPYAPALTAKSISIAPSILGLLSFRPGINVRASGFLGGDLNVSAGVGDKTITTPIHRKQNITLDMTDISLGSVARLASLPLRFEGNISGNIDSQVDTDFAEQPSGDVDIRATKTIIPEGNINTPYGPIGLPKLNMGEIIVQGHTDKGSMEISKLVAGKPGGDLYATATGKVDVRLQKTGDSVQPNIGAYDLNVRLQIGEALRQKVGSFLGVLSSYQTAANTYAFRISAPNSFSTPSLTRSSP
jgi:type II secretion system protein N